MRLDRFLSNLPRFNRQDARQLISQGRIRLDGQECRDAQAEVREFSRVQLDDELLQAGKAARYFMLHKPVGVVSATCHPEHRTVLDLLDEPDKDDLHLAGRLDLNTSGLLLISNDGLWTRRLTLPGSKQPKVYRVQTEQPISTEYIEVFARGLYFAYEDLTTLPAELEILGSHSARLTLHEGRYHQVKRMFGHFQNKVIGLHRERIGPLELGDLPVGNYRVLSDEEVAAF
ncbi:16S rRNA pseudouridine516 synthase [Pseudomonas fluvialis]|uniref:Pseudouridine synthase n=1 Tax=Pseudomonas fluvialis TaxID=1793966 RepID=A0A7X0BVA8_9PSED|nr:pseudouridine synthase [Pseudomonas fluvialis]MBB6343273.1 16S rRNA pseudouridine516 synthase [Pseudomonas fluvialis]